MPRGDSLPIFFVKASKAQGRVVSNFRGLVRGHHRRRRRAKVSALMMMIYMLLDRRPRFVVVNGRAASDGVHRAHR